MKALSNHKPVITTRRAGRISWKTLWIILQVQKSRGDAQTLFAFPVVLQQTGLFGLSKDNSMKRETALQFNVGLGLIIVLLLGVILVGLFYYIPQVDQKIAMLSTRLNNPVAATSNTNDTKVADLTPRLETLEKNYATLVSVVNAKMPNVNLPALLTITTNKGTPVPNIQLAIALIEYEPKQGRDYLMKTLAFSNDEAISVMGQPDRFTKKSLFSNMKIFHRSNS
jgi:hypothetical protein